MPVYCQTEPVYPRHQNHNGAFLLQSCLGTVSCLLRLSTRLPPNQTKLAANEEPHGRPVGLSGASRASVRSATSNLCHLFRPPRHLCQSQDQQVESSYPFPLSLLCVGIFVWEDVTINAGRCCMFMPTTAASSFTRARKRKGQGSTPSSHICLSVALLYIVYGYNTRFAFWQKKWEKGAKALISVCHSPARGEMTVLLSRRDRYPFCVNLSLLWCDNGDARVWARFRPHATSYHITCHTILLCWGYTADASRAQGSNKTS